MTADWNFDVTDNMMLHMVTVFYKRGRGTGVKEGILNFYKSSFIVRDPQNLGSVSREKERGEQ